MCCAKSGSIGAIRIAYGSHWQMKERQRDKIKAKGGKGIHFTISLPLSFSASASIAKRI